eukprot:886347-Pyramimonas_sp.AAC.1
MCSRASSGPGVQGPCRKPLLNALGPRTLDLALVGRGMPQSWGSRLGPLPAWPPRFGRRGDGCVHVLPARRD